MEVKYANLVRLLASHNELVLEFGDFFPGQDEGRTVADQRDFKTRIVLSADMIDVLAQSLKHAAAVRDKARESLRGQPRFNMKEGEVRSA